MTATQKYLFDLHGFVIVEDVLSDAQCEVAKAKIRQRMQPMEKTPDGYDARGTWYNARDLVNGGEPFTTLIDHPKLLAVLTEIIGPKLRLESHYSFVRTRGCPPFEMHGGHRGGRVNFRYYVQGDRIFTGLTVVAFALQEITAADGGFACIPGSHKSDFPVPAEDRARLYAVDGPLVRNIAAPKGSAIIFTETLAHGANTWQAEEPRYGLFYKYNDRAATYHYQGGRLPSGEIMATLSDAQRSFFNTTWEAFGPPENFLNELPEA